MSPRALVTGASSGIGHAFARQLAADGHDLVVVARDEGRLRDLATTVEAGGREVEVLPADLADPAQLATVEERLRRGDVDLLVNNAGFGTTGRFAELPVDEEEQEIRLNVLALTRLTAAAVPGMVAARRGGVINVASIAAFQPTPGTATYGATKAYVLSFTSALREELRGTGVKALVLCPGFTLTEFQDRAGYKMNKLTAMTAQTADEVAGIALKAFARDSGICVPGATNKVAAAATHLAPRRFLPRLAGMISRQV
jgi:short-subunit dehydrogenase